MGGLVRPEGDYCCFLVSSGPLSRTFTTKAGWPWCHTHPHRGHNGHLHTNSRAHWRHAVSTAPLSRRHVTPYQMTARLSHSALFSPPTHRRRRKQNATGVQVSIPSGWGSAHTYIKYNRGQSLFFSLIIVSPCFTYSVV